MTWWEAEQLDEYLKTVEQGLDEWAFSNPEMRIAQRNVDKFSEKIDRALPNTGQQRKKEYLVQLADRIDRLRLDLTERLKREVSKKMPT